MSYGASPFKWSDATSDDEIIERYSELVSKIVFHLKSRLPDTLHTEDLVQVGLIGLLNAAHNYDPTKGTMFETYATIKIRGAVLDEVRRFDWLPRSVYQKARDVASAIREIENREGRDAHYGEIATQMGLSLDEYNQLLVDIAGQNILHFEDVHANQRFNRDVRKEVENHELIHKLADVIQNLPERERIVVSLYHLEERNLKEIGVIMDVSESRVSQILSQALSRIRSRFEQLNGAIEL